MAEIFITRQLINSIMHGNSIEHVESGIGDGGGCCAGVHEVTNIPEPDDASCVLGAAEMN